MRCLLGLADSGKCELLENIKAENEEAYKEAKRMYGSPDFFKNYCAWCIKTLYASRFKSGKYTVVSTL
jgi:hypothetical protein